MHGVLCFVELYVARAGGVGGTRVLEGTWYIVSNRLCETGTGYNMHVLGAQWGAAVCMRYAMRYRACCAGVWC
jgi:hypothetical protein